MFAGGLSFLLFLLLSVPARAQRPLGIDVYAGNGSINWLSVKNAGITFAWAKATEGTYYQDANFTANQVNGKAAGIYMGAYDFCRPDENSPATEADYFWNFAGAYIKNDGRTFMPMLDFETFNGYIGASSYADWVNQWCYDIQTNAAAHGVSVTPVIYVSACNGACDLDSSVAQWRAWIANYNGENAQSGTPWSECTDCEAWGSGVWDFWQFTSSARISGIPGNSSGYCDEDVFDGTTNDLTFFIVGSIAVTSQPTNVIVAVGDTAAFNVSAIGAGVLSYQWLFDQKNIPYATNAALTIANAQLSKAGAYTVVITNVYGNVSNTVYLTVLSDAANSTLLPPDMTNWWPGEKTPVDIYGANSATPYGNLVYSNGEVGSAFHFNGLTSYLIPDNATELAGNWAVCLWVYRQNAPGNSAALMGDSTYALKLEQYNTTREVGLTESGVADYLFTPAYTVPLNMWTHLAFVYSNSPPKIFLYVNGSLVSDQITSNSVVVAPPENLPLPRGCIGGDIISGSLTDPMLGNLDEIQVFSRALSATEIAGIYSAGSNGLVRVPEFTGVVSTSAGRIQINLRGQTGKPFLIYTTTNLSNWTNAGTIKNVTGTTNYTDSTSSWQKFYRVAQP
jgi:GH25 family lysozyme M1 (1,4-beta-N-acetylmuramidase)